ncbi:hypothetical protein D9619_012543 [Psilocybe cf. subviscida]|uniref:BTB domain-containing protein n=1 Tax=Psilocybe cf. subviscida TaxID=2480587 RepID=A0A8H5B877_9AGAR|nr:hypothetical protein D9619_012543 [Psilocybe cf. subviscida]
MSIPARSTRPPTENSASSATAAHRGYLYFEGCVRSPQFWHDGGDTLVCVKATLYRVHRVLLATHSTLFKDDAIGHMATGEPFMDMTVFVPPWDDLREWEHILGFVYNPGRFKKWVEYQRLNELFSLMCTSKALKFETILNLCAERLEMELPTTLDAFDAAYAITRHGSILKATSCISNKAQLFHAINLCVELDCKRALACAYVLALMEASREEFRNGVEMPGGSHIELHAEAQSALLIGDCIFFPRLLNEFSGTLLLDKYCRPHCIFAACQDASEEQEARLRALISHPMSNGDMVAQRRLVFAQYWKGGWLEDVFEDMRYSCSESMKAHVSEQRRRSWEQIPWLFGLGDSWEDLGRM